jgi:hypothetical protein
MLALMMESTRNDEVCRSDSLWCHDTRTEFHQECHRRSGNIKAVMLVLLMEGIYELRR